jgi:CheY-like chemotaxis protein
MLSQAQGSLERAESGYAIGVALVNAFGERYDETVEAASARLGDGAQFVVRPPLSDGSLDPGSDVDGAARPAPSTRPVRILVADDNRDAAASLATLLSLDGHEVSVAYDGKAALGSAETFRPDVALLDIGMPNLNGYEVARSIRAQAWGRSMMLVAVTGWGQSEDKRRAREAGFDHHFTKPLDLDAFSTFLNDALARRRD